MPAHKFSILKPTFNLRSFSARSLGLAIEHLPCCLLTVAAAAVGIPFLSHNPLLELGFAIGGAMIGEYVGHKYIFNKHSCCETRSNKTRRYAIALAIGLTTWGAHQVLLHDHHITPAHSHHHAEVAVKPATPTAAPVR